MARAACDAGCVTINGQVARAAQPVRVDDVIAVALPFRLLRFRVLSVPDRSPSKSGAGELIEVVENRRREDSES
jgi:ribosomal 50S subunit-recycling heat shock protein